MRLTVIGRYGPYPAPGGACSCYLLNAGGMNIVMDMGPGSLSGLLKVTDVGSISAVWISHLHYDHTSDLLPFRYLLEDLGQRIKVVTHPEDTDYYRLLFGHRNIEVTDAVPGGGLRLGGLDLSFYEMDHTAYDLALRVSDGQKTFVYTGDTRFTENLFAAGGGADCVLADCAKPDGFSGPHMTVTHAKEIRRRTGARLIATHLSPGYSPNDDLAGCDGIETAEEGQTYVI